MAPQLKLTYDELEDLIYYSRTGDLSALQDAITTLSQTHSHSCSEVIRAAIDVDEDGLGSGSCLLHYPAANGNVEIVQYLLSQTISSNKTAENQENPVHTLEEMDFINHKNVSGNTALHWAGINGHLEIVKALVTAGADPEVLNAAGRDAVVESEWSSKEGAAECANWILKECGALEKGVGDEDPENNAPDADHNGESSHDQDLIQDNDQDAMDVSGTDEMQP